MKQKRSSEKLMEEKISMIIEPNETFTMAEGKNRATEMAKYIVLKHYQQIPYSADVGIWYVSPEQGKRLTEIYGSAKTVYILVFSPESKSPQALQAAVVMKSLPTLFEVDESNKSSGAALGTANFKGQILFQSCLSFDIVNKFIDFTQNEMEEVEPSKGQQLITLMRKQLNVYRQPPYLSYPGFNGNMMRGFPSSLIDQYKLRDDWGRGGDRGYYMKDPYGYSRASGRESRTKRSHSHGRHRSRSRSDCHSRRRHREDHNRSRRHSRDSHSLSHHRSGSREYREHRIQNIDGRGLKGLQDDYKKAQNETEYAAKKYLKRKSSRLKNSQSNKASQQESFRVHRSRSRERPGHYKSKHSTKNREESRYQKRDQEYRQHFEERGRSRLSSKSEGNRAEYREKTSQEHSENSQSEYSYKIEENDNNVWEEDLIPKSEDELRRRRSNSKDKSPQPAVSTEKPLKKGQTTISLNQRNNFLKKGHNNDHKETKKLETQTLTTYKEITPQQALILVQEGERKIINRMLLKTQAEMVTNKRGKTDLSKLMHSLQSLPKDTPQAS